MYMMPETYSVKINSETLNTNPNLGNVKALVTSTSEAFEKISITASDTSSTTPKIVDGTQTILTRDIGSSAHNAPVPPTNPWKRTSSVQPAKILPEDSLISNKSNVSSKDTVDSDSWNKDSSDKAYVKKKNWVSLDTLSPNIMQQTFSTNNGNKSVTNDVKDQQQVSQQRRSRASTSQPTTAKPSQGATSSNNKTSVEEPDSANSTRRNSGSRRTRFHSSAQVFPVRPRSQPSIQTEVERQPQPNEGEHSTQPPSPVKEMEMNSQRKPARLPASAYQANIFPFRPRRPYHYNNNANSNTDSYQHVQDSVAIKETYTRHALRHQIEYYFSLENLCRDIYLRSHMNNEGWIDLSFIAQFNRVKFFSADVEYIADALNESQIVEVLKKNESGNNYYQIRKIGDWTQWCLPEEVKSGILAQLQIKRQQQVSSGHVHSYSQ